jgi:integrase
LEDYRELLVGRGLSPRTVEIYTGYLARAANWCELHGRRLEHLTAFDLASLPDEITAGQSSSARRQIRSALQHFYEMVGRPDAPTQAIRVPPKPEPVNRSVDVDTARRIVAASVSFGYPKGTAILVGMYQALRRQEIATLRWEYVHHPQPGMLKVIGSKNTGTRIIPLHPTLATHLEPLRDPKGWMFPGRGGDRPVLPGTIYKWVKEIAGRAGMPSFHPHQMRHTVLTAMHDHGGDLRAVASFAGHRRIETTTTYTRTTLDRTIAAQAGVDW